jgi:hypothetical protein
MDRERKAVFEIYEDVMGRQSMSFEFGYENEQSFDGFSLIVPKSDIVSFLMNDLATGRHIIIATLTGLTITITYSERLEVFRIHIHQGFLNIK